VAADEVAAGRLALSDRRGLGVYQNNYRGALMACLADSYPQTLRWLGEAAFEASAARHIDRVPPHSWTLDDYALGFPASLASEWPDDREVAELAA
ncbi:DNA-binding domain-containing protein, partial [Salmonella enterica]|uniref:HvfC/BufC N-terminal domain-containing protein n=1 Tax=Salmonella enterica TaxID=28901 RepID=UPI003D27E831